MRISSIKIYNVSPIFTSFKKEDIKSQNVQRTDTFEKEPYSFNKQIDNLYSKIEKDLNIVNEKDIVKMAHRVSESTGVNLNDVYQTMGKLSQYSSYKSLDNIKKYLQHKNISIVSNLNMFFNQNNIKDMPCLTNVIHYLSVRNFGFGNDRESYILRKRAIFLDSNLINKIKNMPESEKNDFYKYCLKRDKYVPIYISNFENGYNFLNQSNNFEEFTIETLNKAKVLKKENGLDINYNIDYIVNGSILEDLRDLGIKPCIIRQKNSFNPSQIAENLNAIIPDKETFKSIIEEASDEYLRDKNEREKFILDYINKTFTPISAQKYCEHLKDMHSKINKYLEENNRSLDKIYYLIPSNDKSGIIVNYQYQKVNNIKNPNMIYVERDFLDFSKLKKLLPNDATVIILDDCAISGLSYTSEVFDYKKMALRTNQDKNISYVIAPIFTKEYGINKIKKIMKHNKRETVDKIICSQKLPDWKDTEGTFDSAPSPYMTSIIFPYMGPDSNCNELISLFEKFLYNPIAQKAAMGKYD